MFQQAITQVLSPIFEEKFSENSFGFRPIRGAHDALKQCQTNVNDGYVYNELDEELTRRGHRFVRYADDCMIFCKSKKSAERTLNNIVSYIEGKLFLKVNRTKICVSYISKLKELGMDEKFIQWHANMRQGIWNCSNNRMVHMVVWEVGR